ncbi:MAG: hypothetical protein RL135_1319 [Bacteroidota bacterium]|jgi:hypothetical protein
MKIPKQNLNKKVIEYIRIIKYIKLCHLNYQNLHTITLH